jgi:hypothetical protein
VRRRQLDELAERVAALEAVAGGDGGAGRLEARVDALEQRLGALRGDEAEVAEATEAVRRCAGQVAEHVAPGEQLAVASPVELPLSELEGRPLVAFGQPQPGAGPGPRFEHGVAAVASIEAMRANGARFLLLPEVTRPWLERLPELAHHLRARYRVVVDEMDAGVLVDLGARGEDESGEPTLSEELDRLAEGDRDTPILAWTGLDIAALAPGRNVFTPAIDGGELPYLDATIEIVVVEGPDRLAEARRVASGAVVHVEPGETGGVGVIGIEEIARAGERTIERTLVIVPVADRDEEWRARVGEAVGDRPEVEVIASADPWAAAAEAEVAVLVERGVLPMPGCIDALVGTLGAEPEETPIAVAAKLLGPAGTLAAAGQVVFADGTAAGIGEGSDSVAASWHEYVRPVWAAAGMLALRGGQAAELLGGAGSLLGASAALWANGGRVLYQPDAAAVRVSGPEANGGAGNGDEIEAWAPALAGCPQRPLPLDEGAWQTLLASCDAQEAWR